MPRRCFYFIGGITQPAFHHSAYFSESIFIKTDVMLKCFFFFFLVRKATLYYFQYVVMVATVGANYQQTKLFISCVCVCFSAVE